MLVELGPGTLPKQGVVVGIDLHHPINSPNQNAAETPWIVSKGSPNSKKFWSDERESHYILEAESVDEVYASHFMEHIHRGQPLINVMNEAHRILKPGGVFTMIMPLVGYTNPYSGAPESNHIGWQPWSDPTHVNYWWFPEALWYFCEGPFQPNADYGVKMWGPCGPYLEGQALEDALRDGVKTFWGVRNGWEGVARLQRP